MPLHEYLCQDCQARFEAITAVSRADEVACPMCRSVQTRRLISVIAGVGGRSSGAFDSGYASAPSGGCCGGAGGCACGR
ncbi:MAG TPA: zinc ribbon domain-containing protein [Actinomycetota bacterium]|nr:zinc ribbon domain-containing protein [Actinomycetota bacterium]